MRARAEGKSMEYRLLGGTGVQVSKLALDTMMFGPLEDPGRQAGRFDLHQPPFERVDDLLLLFEVEADDSLVPAPSSFATIVSAPSELRSRARSSRDASYAISTGSGSLAVAILMRSFSRRSTGRVYARSGWRHGRADRGLTYSVPAERSRAARR